MNGLRHRLPVTGLHSTPSAFRTTMDGAGGTRTANASQLRAPRTALLRDPSSSQPRETYAFAYLRTERAQAPQRMTRALPLTPA
jgi:hypothetical protein